MATQPAQPASGKYALSLTELSEVTREPWSKLQRDLEVRDFLALGRRSARVPSRYVRDYLERRGVDYSFRVLTYVNLRGGIGKTTSAITCATRAVQYGFRTCILDMDPQGSASTAFDDVHEEDDPIFYDVWQKPREMLLGSLKKLDENLYILPSSLENALLDAALANPSAQKRAVRGVTAELQRNGFDLVIIDCPPSLGAAVISSVCAADLVIVPVGTDLFSFRGLRLTIEEITAICDTFGLDVPEIRVLMTKYDRREKASAAALEELRSKYRRYFLPTVIRTSTELPKALNRRETIFASGGRSAPKQDYDHYVRHILGIDRVLPIEEEQR